MAITPDSPIIGPPSGSLIDAASLLYGPLEQAESEYRIELWRLAPLVGIDPAILFAQAAHGER